MLLVTLSRGATAGETTEERAPGGVSRGSVCRPPPGEMRVAGGWGDSGGW